MAKQKKDEKVKKADKSTVKANSRGYAFLGKVKGAPDFSKIKTAEIDYDDNGNCVAKLGKGNVDAGQMLRRGYLHIGPNKTKKITFGKNLIKVS
jgi:hypothetical protein